MVGRRYAGLVKQIISGSIGLDDWEWGVDLWSDDPLWFKKLIYEMRFDEVSANYADFGDFYVGRVTSACYSPRMEKNIGLAMMPIEFKLNGETVIGLSLTYLVFVLPFTIWTLRGFVEGVQIYHEGDTVSVVTPHFLRPMRLTMSELCALELGLTMLRRERTPEEHRAIDGALERLRGAIVRLPPDDAGDAVTATAPVPPGRLEHLRAIRDAQRFR